MVIDLIGVRQMQSSAGHRRSRKRVVKVRVSPRASIIPRRCPSPAWPGEPLSYRSHNRLGTFPRQADFRIGQREVDVMPRSGASWADAYRHDLLKRGLPPRATLARSSAAGVTFRSAMRATTSCPSRPQPNPRGVGGNGMRLLGAFVGDLPDRVLMQWAESPIPRALLQLNMSWGKAFERSAKPGSRTLWCANGALGVTGHLKNLHFSMRRGQWLSQLSSAHPRHDESVSSSWIGPWCRSQICKAAFPSTASNTSYP